MNDRPEEQLYSLLARIYRERDALQGGPLRALLAVMEAEFRSLEGDIDQLYANLFAETAEEWVLPYIGDLIGLRNLGEPHIPRVSRRAEVANALTYRRRKGTSAVLEHVIRDVTGWKAHVVEFFDLLVTTQHVGHVRPHKGGVISLRDRTVLQRLGTPFDTAPHTANVRNVFSPRPEQATRAVSPGGRHNIHNVGIFVWRLQSYPVARAEARLVAPGRYTFNPFGLDAPLFNPPMTEPQVTSPEQEVNLPGPLSREALRAEAEALREGRTTGRRSQACYLGTQPVFQVFLNERAEPVAPEALDIADLTNWAPPPDSKRYLNPGAGESTSFTIAAAVDPELGRITVPEGPPPLRVEVGYSYGFSSDLGGGTYQRAEVTPPERAWTAKVSHHPQSGAASSAWFSTLGEALAAWGRSEQDGDIEVSDSAIYDLGGTATIRLVRGRRLVIRAFEGRRPCLVGNLVVAGDESDTGITLSGLLLDGSVTLLGNVQPHCSHCTVRPSGSKARHSVAI